MKECHSEFFNGIKLILITIIYAISIIEKSHVASWVLNPPQRSACSNAHNSIGEGRQNPFDLFQVLFVEKNLKTWQFCFFSGKNAAERLLMAEILLEY
jgi:hypothetical protein